MTDDRRPAAQIETPCTRICLIHPEAGICAGCLRTRDEIAGWRNMSPEQRQEIMQALPGRAGRLRVRRGGRKGRQTDA